ncbi:MAG TPA: glycosyltransferase [Patescibacteria group bacterium]|nr:glycosyltransferase [Patescibacteria group bacterium]
MSDEKVKLFSVIMPAYRQEHTVARDIRSIYEVLETMNVPFELIIVIDGEVDGSLKAAQSVKKKGIIVVGYAVNKGKGYAVRYGMAQSSGDVVGFIDAGGDLKPESLPLMLDTLVWNNADIVIGSKRHPLSKTSYPIARRIFSWGYQMLIRILFNVNVRDTQVGMKLYRRRVLSDVLPRLLVKQFAFDIEILAVAHRLGYTKILEAPIELDFEGVKSSIKSGNFWRVIFNMIKDTLAVFYRLHILHYYDDASKRKWRFDPDLNFRINIG